MNNRIEFIDALRGFTMLLVVYSHIQIISIGITPDVFTLNSIFVNFFMPLFFFISGFILYKKEYNWNILNFIFFIKKKFLALIIPTLFFIILYSECFNIPFCEIIKDNFKFGYWFTITLFEFFFFYILSQFAIRLLNNKKYEDPILIFFCITVFIIFIFAKNNYINKSISSIIGIPHWQLYVYLLFGYFTKKYYNIFQKIIESKYFLAAIHLSFIITLLLITSDINGGNFVLKNYLSVTGVIIVFSSFRKYEYYLKKDYKIGFILQLIGRRTLDIYLIHYFLLPNLYFLKDFLNSTNVLVEFSISITFAILVITACLLISAILRTSPLLGHYLFGAKSSK